MEARLDFEHKRLRFCLLFRLSLQYIWIDQQERGGANHFYSCESRSCIYSRLIRIIYATGWLEPQTTINNIHVKQVIGNI